MVIDYWPQHQLFLINIIQFILLCQNYPVLGVNSSFFSLAALNHKSWFVLLGAAIFSPCLTDVFDVLSACVVWRDMVLSAKRQPWLIFIMTFLLGSVPPETDRVCVCVCVYACLYACMCVPSRYLQEKAYTIEITHRSISSNYSSPDQPRVPFGIP